MELRPAYPPGATSLPFALDLCRWLQFAGRRSCSTKGWLCSACRRYSQPSGVGGVGRGGIIARQEPGAANGGGGRGAAPAHAGDDPRVWPGMPTGAGRAGGYAAGTRRLLPAIGGGGSSVSIQCRGRHLVRDIGAGAGEPAGRPAMGDGSPERGGGERYRDGSAFGLGTVEVLERARASA